MGRDKRDNKGFEARFIMIPVFLFKKGDKVVTPDGEAIICEDMDLVLNLDHLSTLMLEVLIDDMVHYYYYSDIKIYSEN